MGSLKTNLLYCSRVIITLLLLGISSHISAQIWHKNYPGYVFLSDPCQVVQSYDKSIGICMEGINPPYDNYGVFYKSDVNGNIIDSSILPQGGSWYSDINITKDRGLIVGGSTDILDTNDMDPLLLKLDVCGKKQWCAAFPHYYLGAFVDQVLQTSDGGYIIVLGNYGAGIYTLCRLDSAGKFQWTYTCPATTPSVIMAEKNGCVLIAGSNYFEAFTAKISANGNIIWENNYGLKEHTQANLYSIVKTRDNGYLSIVSQSSPPITNLLMKQDSNGNILWTKSLDSNLNGGGAYCMVFDSSDNNYIALVSQTDTNTFRTWTSLVKFDSTGHVLKTRNYDDSSCVLDFQMIPTYDHKFLISGDYGPMVNDYVGFHLYKVNPDLSPADLDTGHFIYNGLCPNMPKSDTLNLDGYFIVNFDTANERQFADSNINTQDYSTLTNIAPVKNSLLKITISPNPFSDILHVTIISSDNFNHNSILRVVNSLGVTVQSQVINIEAQSTMDFFLNLSGLSSGYYHIEIQDAENVLYNNGFIKN